MTVISSVYLTCYRDVSVGPLEPVPAAREQARAALGFLRRSHYRAHRACSRAMKWQTSEARQVIVRGLSCIGHAYVRTGFQRGNLWQRMCIHPWRACRDARTENRWFAYPAVPKIGGDWDTYPPCCAAVDMCQGSTPQVGPHSPHGQSGSILDLEKQRRGWLRAPPLPRCGSPYLSDLKRCLGIAPSPGEN